MRSEPVPPTDDATMREHAVNLPGGRSLQVREEGDPKGDAVFALHGTPGSRLLAPPVISDAKEQSIRLIGYDRPGYGLSTSHHGRTIAGVADDVAAIADILGIERFGVWGHSGGGAPALACAARLRHRVVAAASLAGVAPFDAAGLDWTAGMGELNVEDVTLALHDRPAWLAKTKTDREAIMGMTAEELKEAWRSLISEEDRRAVTPQVGEFIIAQVREGMRPGIDGFVDDNLAEFADWGFSVSEIRVPVQVWHGQKDLFVPYAHGEWFARNIPGVEAHLEPDEGHVTLFQRVPEVHRWLKSHF